MTADLDTMTRRAGEWLRGEGPSGDVVISSRIRLARNLAGHLFVNRASGSERRDILDRCRASVIGGSDGAGLLWLELDQQPDLDRQILVERQLISRQHAEGDEDEDEDEAWPRAVGVDGEERFAVMVNEEDHVRMAVLRSGLRLADAFEHVDAIDDQLEAKLDWSYTSRLGYLTACPTNVGTGLRASVMVHLPALKLTGEIDKVRRAARDMHLAVRGLFGEGSEALGDLYQISNQTTLGRSEREILESLEEEVVPEVISYEKEARDALLERRRAQLEDRVWRAWAILSHARVISAEEVLSLLSHLRLGVNLGLLDRLEMPVINELFLLTQPAHLQKLIGRELDRLERHEARARLIRERLAGESN